MSRVIAVAGREIRSQVVSPIAWVVWTLFLLLAGWFFFNLVTQFSIILGNYQMYAQLSSNPALLERVNLNEIVIAGLFRNLLLLLVFFLPILSMRTFAEERKQRTDELLLTSPITPGQIVAGKYLGLLFVTSVLVVSPLLFVGILSGYGDPEHGPIWTGLLGLALAGAALAALGLAVSTMTESQVSAAVTSFVLFLVLFVLDWPADSVEGWLRAVLQGMALPTRYDSFAKGLIASPDVAYFISLAVAGLFVARGAVASQRFR